MSRAEQKTGKHGEEWAMNAVRQVGIEMVEPIGTPVKIVRTKKMYDGTWHQIVWGEKVSGDAQGIIPGTGRRVITEIKTILDRNLQWSDLRPHQPGRLTMNAELGGLSLLVWVHHSGVYVMDWNDVLQEGFRRGKGLTPEQAEKLRLPTIK